MNLSLPCAGVDSGRTVSGAATRPAKPAPSHAPASFGSLVETMTQDDERAANAGDGSNSAGANDAPAADSNTPHVPEGNAPSAPASVPTATAVQTALVADWVAGLPSTEGAAE